MPGCGEKLAKLTSGSQYDVCMPGECMQMLTSSACITYNQNASGCNRMLKVLLHGSCSYDCAYCPVRVDRSRLSFAPRELAETFFGLYRKNLVGGLFLSSGIPYDTDDVMSELIETARILRNEGYAGYLHLKILPGAQRPDINEAAQLADRISLNVETTGESRLRALSGIKDYAGDIIKRLGWIAEAAPGHHTTQLVIGAAGETDREIFNCVTALYERMLPSRIYYSAFKALPKTRLASRESTPAWRSRRWYQMDYLIREYGFNRTELLPLLEDCGTLQNDDPKALLARGREPVDPNVASFADLVHVPGIGTVTARAIIQTREHRTIRTPRDLGVPGSCLKRALPYLAFSGAARQATLAGFH
ncbi:MAG: radical SAM protein [Methanoregula sp.]|jgi:predicted DNA-binding helix-hairpin-helix protein|uniref:radical SAM protein n=1 Tax=Methanoregula sp. TaxID=2052170 RepID=UPI003D0D2B96